MNFSKILNKAETFAEKIIEVKDYWLSKIVDGIIPQPKNRKLFRNFFKRLISPLSSVLATKFDYCVENNIITVANLISTIRALTGLLLIIFVQYKLGMPFYIGVFTFAVLTDYFDGVIARRMNEQSDIGAAMDAGCDKIFAVCAAIAFWSYFWWWPLLGFLIFDGILATMAITLLVAKIKNNYQGDAEVKSNWLGKTKFNLQGLTLISFLLGWYTIGNYCLILADIFALGSIIRHLEPKKSK